MDKSPFDFAKWGKYGLQLLFIAAITSFLAHFVLIKDPDLEVQAMKVINVHEHMESMENVPKYLKAMDRNGIAKTVLMGSPAATFHSGEKGFSREEQNNLEVLQIANRYPKRFMAFPTINPKDPDKLKKLKDYRKVGAKGLKLYGGHEAFHDLPLDTPEMEAVYEYCEDHQMPVMFHVNPADYQDEFEHVLQRHPDLKVICPHFCLSTIEHERFEYLMDRYSNLYTDLSFGFINYLENAMKRFSRMPGFYRELITKYQDRILFGTDIVISEQDYQDTAWISRIMRAYRNMLEKETYSFYDLPEIELKGLRLEAHVLRKIYRDNFKRLMKTL